VRVDNRQRAIDLPAARTTLGGQPGGGWWNWGGILGNVYLRRVDRLDIASAQVLPRLPCRTCPATIDYRVTVRNYGPRTRVHVASRFGGRPLSLGARTLPAGGARTFRGSQTVQRPRLWAPPHPDLYPVTIDATGGGSARWSLMSGIRSLAVRGGRLLLNWRPVAFRGVFMHQDSPGRGGAVTPARMRLFVRLARQLGATVLRTHYPLDPYLHELADREGLMIWSEIPAYQLRTATLARPSVRAAAASMLRADILANGNHPSVLAWSIGNELNPNPTAVEARYFRRQSSLAHSLDPTRPVALAIQGLPSAGCQPAYRPIDLLGVNSYFGWYPGPGGELSNRRGLSPYLNQVRRCYPRQAIAVTEFGAEANRGGSAREHGTYAFQARLNAYHLRVYASKPWLSGAIGMLMAFRVRPGWTGGNPKPSGPMHQKGVFDLYGRPKPAAAVVSRWFHSTRQYDLP
jgi:beta-glucuronidase